jgi:hypothetical protein
MVGVPRASVIVIVSAPWIIVVDLATSPLLLALNKILPIVLTAAVISAAILVAGEIPASTAVLATYSVLETVVAIKDSTELESAAVAKDLLDLAASSLALQAETNLVVD